MERYTLEWLLSYTKHDGDCLVWTRAVDKDGYGQSGPYVRRFKVHREVMKLLGHDIDGKLVMHTCDNTSCINPEHLKAGTYADNNSDRANKGRSHVGAWRVLIPQAQELIDEGYTNVAIEEAIGMPSRRVSELRNNKLFKAR